MSNQFKLQDSVQLLHGSSPIMTISEINENEALCIFFEPKKKEIKRSWIPLNVLKPTSPKAILDKSDVFKAVGYRP